MERASSDFCQYLPISAVKGIGLSRKSEGFRVVLRFGLGD